MSRILLFVMVFSFLLYSFVGCFGYLTFADSPNQLMGGIILLADYKGSVRIKLSLALFCFSLILAFPLNVKPTKEGLRELMGGGRRRREEGEEGGTERDGEMEHCIWTFRNHYLMKKNGLILLYSCFDIYFSSSTIRDKYERCVDSNGSNN